MRRDRARRRQRDLLHEGWLGEHNGRSRVAWLMENRAGGAGQAMLLPIGVEMNRGGERAREQDEGHRRAQPAARAASL